ncbi:MAG: 4-hydroxy-2-oxoheptanedioate aldolase [Phenylobacterium sp.]|uniref:4-hydroxy-2-oxoheptanedioate aldolase n=1 Tax=Phenylobacterium sp. TaxID=1871053 RepID=UPI001A26181E|nr:4-hydroxy-2-oxoheptanedioate aldolase [Phenylobacterium sp.]MBJ7411303.1 4-hydroxy-2-oxoheptanedioate aldolase [Phenylobacterium sp.]
MQANPFKAALRAGQAQIGLWQALASPYTAEICAEAGFDWLLFDGEHGPNDVPSLLSQLQATSGGRAHAVARPPIGETWMIKQYLDLGFTSLLIPLVETGAQAELLVRAVRYPPQGLRGVGTGVARAARWGRTADYLDHADEEICLLVQVETTEGLRNLDDILAVEGVDGVFIGPADLSAALGHRGRPSDPTVLAAIEEAIGRVRGAGKAAGILNADKSLARRYLELGCTFVAVGSDVGLLVRGSDSLAADFRDEIGSGSPSASPY